MQQKANACCYVLTANLHLASRKAVQLPRDRFLQTQWNTASGWAEYKVKWLRVSMLRMVFNADYHRSLLEVEVAITVEASTKNKAYWTIASRAATSRNFSAG